MGSSRIARSSGSRGHGRRRADDRGCTSARAVVTGSVKWNGFPDRHHLHQIWYIHQMTPPDKVIVARFYRLASGREPVREWLREFSIEDRKSIGRDLMKVEFGWPCGPPLCRPLTGYTGLYEVRSRLSGGRSIRVFFAVSEGIMLLLHGFIKKSRVTPEKELKLAERRRREYERNG